MLVIPVFVPHAGCPHDCCFCNQKIISGQTSMPTAEDVVKTIERFKNAAARYEQVQLAFYGGSFTAIDVEEQLFFLNTVQPYLKNNGGFIDLLRLSTRPDCIDETVLERMAKYGVGVIELGAQSMDDVVLFESGRGHTSADTVQASKLIKERGFELGIQTMTGLPFATEESDIKTARLVCALQPDFVRIYPTVVVNGTGLHKQYLDGKYLPRSLEQSVDLCAKLWSIYDSSGIKVIRMGLQSSDNISDDGEIAAGPYHAAFGQLVKSEKIFNKVCDLLGENYNEYKKKTLTIYIDKTRISDCVGQKRSNIDRWKTKYNFSKVAVRCYESCSVPIPVMLDPAGNVIIKI
jgi:histone acetyltransferase (RNA polymerase elongator complex component)